MKGKVIIFSAPSGSGKTTLVHRLLAKPLNLHFSVSATSRPSRGTEVHGKDYYFLTPAEFRTKIAEGAFLEFEEVYPGKFYGTLKSDVERMLSQGKNVLFDVDVQGGLHIKQHYDDQALAIFVQPPGIEVLEQRLQARGTDAPDVIRERVAKAAYELTFAPQFDRVVINDNLESAEQDCLRLVTDFLQK